MSRVSPFRKIRDDPNRDMSEQMPASKTQMTWIDVQITEDGKFFKTKHDFYMKDFPECYSCKSKDYLWLVKDRSGVGILCANCNMVNIPITTDLAVERKKVEITINEAIEIRKAQGWDDNTMPIRALLVKLRRMRRKLSLPKEIPE